MVELQHEAQSHDGTNNDDQQLASRQHAGTTQSFNTSAIWPSTSISDAPRNVTSSHSELSIPKNRSTGNLLTIAGANGQRADKGRIRFSFDSGSLAAQEYENMSRSPIMTEHEHGLGTSGLRRIRQQPPSRQATLISSTSDTSDLSAAPRSGSLILDLPSRKSSYSTVGATTPAHGSPTFTEDLTRFPSESLHSFSFAHQSEESIHNRQNILKRSIEFMKDRMGSGWSGAQSAGYISAQARISGDDEMQSVLDLLAKAKLTGPEGGLGLALTAGSMTGPARTDVDNIFDTSFKTRSESPEAMVRLPPSVSHTDFAPANVSTSATKAMSQHAPSDISSRTTTNESATTAKSSPPSRPQSLKRTYTNVSAVDAQNKLSSALAQPFNSADRVDVGSRSALWQASKNASQGGSISLGPAVHNHSSRWTPAAQAIFTTESSPPYTILAANDLACLVFGVTKAEVRKMGIMEVVREERRAWLASKLALLPEESGGRSRSPPMHSQSQQNSPKQTTSFMMGAAGGVTARLLSKAPSRAQNPRRSKTDDGAGSSLANKRKTSLVKGSLNHPSTKSRGVLLCGDVVPIQKRNGATGAASLWVKEKKHGLIWVLEEIHEDVAMLHLDDEGKVLTVEGGIVPIWGEKCHPEHQDVNSLLPRLPRQGSDGKSADIDWVELMAQRYFTCRNTAQVNIPAAVEKLPDTRSLRISSFPHIAGIICLSARNLEITSSNSVFSAALFGQDNPDGLHVIDVIPDFDRILRILVEEDGVELIDGLVIPEHSFRRARAFLALRDGRADAASFFLRPTGLPARHRDGQEIMIDVQMRVVKSERQSKKYDEHAIMEEEEFEDKPSPPEPEMIYALWITYSRHLHAVRQEQAGLSPSFHGVESPPRQPSPGQVSDMPSPTDMDSDDGKKESSRASILTEQLRQAAIKTATVLTGYEPPTSADTTTTSTGASVPTVIEPEHKKSIIDFVILEEMGQGAYGQVKLARYKKSGVKMVLKYVTKKRILVDTWTRDRRLGTVPLEIHVLDYLRRDGFKHPNIVEMADFFEDDINYYIEMVPHGLPGMDLFDYIELRVNMQEAECQSIFRQVACAVEHLHLRAKVVHRDIKDENVVLDGEGMIKLIDFGSAAYIKSGPFDVFVGTIDYAAPEVLAGKPYRGKEQDVWALGILLYTIVYKENPFYSIDEIMDRDLRVPYVMSEDSIDLIRGMLNRDVEKRLDIESVMAHRWLAGVAGKEVQAASDVVAAS